VSHHDALRLRFVEVESGWMQRLADDTETIPLCYEDCSQLSSEERTTQLENKANEFQRSLNLSEGPVFHVSYFDYGEDEAGRLLFIIHHLAVDGVSWRILLEDLQQVYRQLERGEAVSLPAKTTSVKEWSTRIHQYAQTDELKEELAYWAQIASAELQSLPVDYPVKEGANTISSSETIRVSLNAEETRQLLQEVPEAYHTQINDVLLVALVRSLSSWTGGRQLLLDMEGHGREDVGSGIDLSRTVGWFTTIYPVLLELNKGGDISEDLKETKERLRNIPNKGIGFGLLRYLNQASDIREKLKSLPHSKLVFNYLGQFDQSFSGTGLLGWANQGGGRARSPASDRIYLLSVVGSISNGRLNIRWTYSCHIHKHATIQALSEKFLDELRLVITHCSAEGFRGYTPSDFPEAGLDQSTLDELIADLDKSGGDRGRNFSESACIVACLWI